MKTNMKKLIFLVLLVGLSMTLTQKAIAVTQTVILAPGWNVVSTPMLLNGHEFSAPETSVNFDIFALDASKISGWATIAELGHNTFHPLFGYFINNKTGESQTLAFLYKTDIAINERFFERAFSASGWYSVGIANPSYAKDVYDAGVNTGNQTGILSLVDGSYDSVIDFTDAKYFTNRNSLAMTDPWRLATALNIINLNDFRETKGYAIYIKNAGAKYIGFQNIPTEPVIPEPPPLALLTISTNVNSPNTNQVVASSGTDNNELDGLELLRFDLRADNDMVVIHDMPVTLSWSGTATTTTMYLYDGNTLIGSEVANSGTVTFINIDYSIPRDATRTLTVKVDVRGATSDPTIFSASILSASSIVARNSLNQLLSSEAKTGSATGADISVIESGPEITLVSKSVIKSSTGGDTGTTTAQATFNIGIRAVGRDVGLADNGAFDVALYNNNAIETTAATASYVLPTQGTFSTTGGRIIPEGSTINVQVTAIHSVSVSDAPASFSFGLEAVNWGPAGSLIANAVDFMAGMPEWRTSSVVLP
jgi:hypothetical protein